MTNTFKYIINKNNNCFLCKIMNKNLNIYRNKYTNNLIYHIQLGLEIKT